ncbi:MAG: PAS domain S-box protein, partial [Candidatus Stygibacter frigidus]|nr:PAS domain S-box protein [Candidatus Stygibacter frigidus]
MPFRHVESESLLQQCLDISSGMFIGLDKLGNVILANEKASEILGLPIEEIIGKNWFDIFIPGVEGEEVRAVFAKIITREITSVEFFENEVITYTGDLKTIRWHNSILYDRDNNVIGLLSSGADITALKDTSSALSKKEQQLQKIFDLLPIGLWITDEKGKLVSGNPAGVKIWGAEPHVGIEEYGMFKAWRMPGREEIMPEDWALAHTIKEGVTIENELLEIEAFDGKKKLILNYTAPLMTDDGKIEGAIVVNLDVTEEKKLEQSLAESEERFQQAMKATRDGLFDWNLITNEIYYSPGWKAILGYSDDEIISNLSDWEKLTHPDHVAMIMEMVDNLLKGKIDRLEIEFKMKHKDGDWVDILSRAKKILDKSGKAVRIVGTHVDITELKQYREKLEELVLQRTEDLEEKNAELQKYNKLFIGREFRIKELREEVKELKRKL